MAKTDTLHIRIEPSVKEKAEETKKSHSLGQSPDCQKQ